MSKQTKQPAISPKPGAGDREADRRYRERVRDFVESGKVPDAAENAANMTEEERTAAREAEKAARARKRS